MVRPAAILNRFGELQLALGVMFLLGSLWHGTEKSTRTPGDVTPVTSLSLSLSDVPGSPLGFDTLKEFIILAKVVTGTFYELNSRVFQGSHTSCKVVD